MVRATLPASLRPKPGVPLLRIGPVTDGGYFVAQCSISPTAHLLSLGLNDDWRFEEAFIALADCDLTVYDHTVDAAFWVKRRIARVVASARPDRHLPGARPRSTWRSYRHFFDQPGRRHIRRKIGYDGDGAVSIGSALDLVTASPVFLKCDVEGWEWRSFADVGARADRLTGVAVEFHDVDLHLGRLVDLLRQLQSDFEVVHVQANNFGLVSPSGVPQSLEVSLAPRWLLAAQPALAPASLRSVPVAVNNPERPAIDLAYAD